VYLKRLELTGFKSFAAKTTFDFGQGLTAIVGPNGSGKSNIADGMRWVMGESGGKLIRAKKLEDVIFTGSAKRPKADRVEVALVLDNSSGWLPIDTDEVSIMRRGSRSGDSDYFVNGVRTKLRDIQTIFATAAVTQSSYAIIGQGLVEHVLNLKPEDRRELVEEAADIQRYRYKIEEAETRLKQTHENIERVKLLVKEISPRMTALERQAKRAGEHAVLTQQLQAALREFYETRWAHAQEAVTVARANHDQAHAEFLQARVALETVQRELDEITVELEKSRKVSAAALAEKDKLDRNLREIEQRVAVASERRGLLQSRQKELAEEAANAERERARAEKLLSSDGSENKKLEEAVEKARIVFQERQTDLANMEAEFREAHVHAADADAKNKRLTAAAAEMKIRIKRLSDGIDQLEKDVARLHGRRRQIIQQMTEHVRLIRGLRAQDQELTSEASEASENRQAIEADVQEIREQLSAVEANQNARRGKLEGLEARLQVMLEAQEQAAEEPAEGVTIEGAVATVYEFLRVPRGLEDAIAAVLMDSLEAFVFEHQSDAVAAIESLVRQKGPRTLAIPLETIKPMYPLSVLKEKGVLGVAADLVKYPGKYDKLMNMLLGRVIVVQDTATAVRLLRRRVGTIVTQDGIVFDQSGVISGGRPQENKAFTLAYERDLEALPKEIDKLYRSIEVTETQAKQLRAELKAAEAAASGSAREAESVLERRLKLQDQVAVRQEKLAQLRGEMRGLMGSIANAREQQGTYREQVSVLEKERDALIEEAKEASQTAKHLGSADTLFKDRRKALRKAADDAADALGRADAELRSLRVSEENAKSQVARIEAQAAAKSSQLNALEKELQALATTLTRDEKELEAARMQVAKLMEKTQPQEGAHHLEARQSDLHKQVVAGQNRLFEAERRSLEAETEVKRWDAEIENLQHRMTEDGMVLRKDGTVVPERPSDAAPPEVPAWLPGEEGGASGLRPMSGAAEVNHDKLGKEIDALRSQLRQLGPVNVEATADYESLKDRHDFLSGQMGDLKAAEEALRRAIVQLSELMRKKFQATFDEVADNFKRNFNAFFGGGHAKLKMSDPKHPSTTGIEIEAQPPGKRTHSLAQLSGGEKSLTSVSLLFALLQANPSPFCILDEVDAMLDEANVGRFAKAIKEQSKRTQFIVVTHNRRTIEQADSIYGISMANAESRVLSMRLGDIPLSVASGSAEAAPASVSQN
jgi:chromosome segregation protein